MLRVSDLTLSYAGAGEPVLAGASLEVGAGRFVSLVGPSGSGKSTILRAVMGLQRPSAGEIELDGVEPTEIVVTGHDPDGNTVRVESRGFEARCLLHEIDHLDGILFLDRVDSLKRDVFRRKRYAH